MSRLAKAKLNFPQTHNHTIHEQTHLVKTEKKKAANTFMHLKLLPFSAHVLRKKFEILKRDLPYHMQKVCQSSKSVVCIILHGKSASLWPLG